jgi:hypothetical protein
MAAACHEQYPQAMTLFGLENLTSVLELASLGLSDHEIVERVAAHSGPLDPSDASALNVAFAVSGVDFQDAGYMFHVMEANLQGALEESKSFNQWIRSAIPAKKVVFRGEGTSDVMLFHALLLSNQETGFVRKPTKDSVWSDFTYAHGPDKELRICAQKPDLENFSKEQRQGVLEKKFDFDLEVMKVKELYESTADVSWFVVSDNDLRASSTATGGTLQSRDKKL